MEKSWPIVIFLAILMNLMIPHKIEVYMPDVVKLSDMEKFVASVQHRFDIHDENFKAIATAYNKQNGPTPTPTPAPQK